jgi:hypothetical protein
MTQKDSRLLPEQELQSLNQDLQTIRIQLEEQAMRTVSQVAYSTDGRTFGYEAPLSLPIPIGCYVLLVTPGQDQYLGQIITKEVAQREGAEIAYNLDEQAQSVFPQWLKISETKGRLRVRALEGTGVLLGKLTGDRFVPTTNTDTFPSATITLADATVVGDYLASVTRKKSTLPIGQALYLDGRAIVQLNAAGFNRHTVLCGQSGSGKTFSLGIVLEQLLLETDLRIVIIDPNSDFVQLGHLRPLEEVNRLRSAPLSTSEYAELAKRYRQATAGLQVFRPALLAGDAAGALRVRFGDLSRREQGTVLELDPLQDREEFNAFWKIVGQLGHEDYSWNEVRNAIGQNYTAEVRQLGLRIENLGIADWEIWCSPGDPSLIDAMGQEDWRCLILDIGTLGTAAEKAVIANAVLSYFWRQRNQRQPVLIVVDEAHNICPQEPGSELQAISTQEVIRIAGEGRKFGLYLLLATQRPSKIHANVLSQCDNLMLMRMNAQTDLDHLTAILSQVPDTLMAQATKFKLGESLLAGRLVQNPTFAKFEGRLSLEGGSDVPATWAARRP